MKLDSVLHQLGYSQKEARVYLALLKLGEGTVTDLATGAQLPRTSIYTHLKSLIQKEAVEFYKRRGRRVYLAVRPEKLLSRSQARLQIFSENLPFFEAISGTGRGKPDVRMYEGKDASRELLNSILREQRPILAVTSIEDMRLIVGQYFSDFIEQRIKQQLPIKLLTNQSPDAVRLRQTDSDELRSTRFVKYRFHTANYIAGDKVAMVSLTREPHIGLLIEDPAIAETHRMFFNLIWESASQG